MLKNNVENKIGYIFRSEYYFKFLENLEQEIALIYEFLMYRFKIYVKYW